ncbi:MAG TPA: protease inhibitor I42 family protein [Myxococcaceae bacterium]|nr:protease inhibitor I42 family protein [Myxococcaceae bacterium]
MPHNIHVAKPKPKTKSGAAKPGSRKNEARLGLLKKASAKVAKAAAKLVKSAAKSPPKAASSKASKSAAKPPAQPARPAPKPASVPVGLRAPEKPRPRATKLPPVGEPLTKREIEQILTPAAGRGVGGEGSLKGRLVVKDGMPYLHVIGRDKRELVFLLQGPEQEVLPAYVDHKVSVTGLIKKTHNYGGTVDVRKYAAKRADAEPIEVPQVEKLRYLSPGEVEQIGSAGMGAGMRGFASVRGALEMSGEDFILVVSNAGTRQQVTFRLAGKMPKSFRKNMGQPVQVTGVVHKESGWGGTIEVENAEVRPADTRGMSRDALEVLELEGVPDEGPPLEIRIGQGLAVRIPERAGYTWAVEPTVAKRVGLREANFMAAASGAGTREFFFTPRNPGQYDVDFFLAKVFAPSQVARTQRLTVAVRA